MFDTKSLASMSSRDTKYEIVRPRPKKDKDRDRDSDKRSSIASTGGIIVKRSRESATTKSSVISDLASQVGTDTLSNATYETQSSESSFTSPLSRTSSAVSLTSRTSPSAIQTPLALQPYLESESGEVPTTVVPEMSTAVDDTAKEWIGPKEDTGKTPDELEDSSTPKPMRRVSPEAKGKEPVPRSSGSPNGKNWYQRSCNTSQLTNYSEPYDNPFYPSHITNATWSTNPAGASSSSPQMPGSVQLYNQPYPQPPSSPSQTWHDAPSKRSSSVVSANRSITSAPSSVTTYVGQPQPHGYQPQENPMMLLHRVSSAIPDISMLTEHFREICATLGHRESQIRQLETRREADARRQEDKIEKLTHEIEAVLAKYSDKVDRLEAKISKLEDSKAELQRNLARESQSKEDTKSINERLRAEQRQLVLKYLEEKEEMAESHAREIDQLTSDHATSQRTLSERAQAQALIADAETSRRLGDLHRLHEHEKQAFKDHGARERRELEESHLKVRRDLEMALAAKVKIIDEECIRMRQAWQKEHDELVSLNDEEKVRHRKELEDHFHDLNRHHQKDKDEMKKSIESCHAAYQAKNLVLLRDHDRTLESQLRQGAEDRSMIARLQKEADAYERHSVDAQEVIRKLREENSKMQTALETLQSHQQQLESQSSIRKTHNDNDFQNRSRTPSRQKSDPQETIKLRRDLENERGRNEDAQDTIIKLRRDVEGMKSNLNNTERKQQQASQRTPPEEKKLPLQKISSNESGTSQRLVEGSGSAAKLRTVTSQT